MTAMVADRTRIIVLLAFAALGGGAAAAQDASEPPWHRYGPDGGHTAALANLAAKRRPGTLCGGTGVTTESPLDRVRLAPVAAAEYAPALAQTAGLVAMVAADRREAVRSTAIHVLQARGQWSAAAQDGYFEFLLHEADGVREKVARTRGMLGTVFGGVEGVIAGRTFDDVTGAYGYGGQGSMAGASAGRDAAQRLAPTDFAVSDDDAFVEAVVDMLVQHPCDLSSADALHALRT